MAGNKNSGRKRKPTPKVASDGVAKPPPLRSVKPPAHLSPAAVKHWKAMAPKLKKLGYLTSIDVMSFSVLCEAMGRWHKANAELKKTGQVIEGKAGPKVSPWYRILRDAQAEMRPLLNEFGMTPSARAGMGKVGGGKSEDEEFFGH